MSTQEATLLAAIIAATASGFAAVIASVTARRIAKEAARAQLLLETFKSDLAQSTARISRYEGAQFGAYQEIWEALSDLRVASDRLWDRATARNVAEFGHHFESVRGQLYAHEVVLDRRNLNTLRQLIDQFRDFYEGKNGLVDLRRDRPNDEAAVAALIERNGQIRAQYSATLDQLATALRHQLTSSAR